MSVILVEYKLGRIPKFDERSREFPIRPLLSDPKFIGKAPVKRRSYTWNCPVVLNQRFEGACVGFAWAHELLSTPVAVKNLDNESARSIYKHAQTIDEWPGESYEGTSVLAGVKATQKLHPDTVKEYRWAFGITDVIETIARFGPVVLGINWYKDMYTPAKGNNAVIRPTGPLVGGHAILAIGYKDSTKMIRLHNSWGSMWGSNGQASISYDDLDRLLKENGEACVIVQRGRGEYEKRGNNELRVKGVRLQRSELPVGDETE